MYGTLETTTNKGMGFPRAQPQLKVYNGITFIQHAVTTYASLSAVVPPKTRVGDLIVACLFNRGAITKPEGWVLAATQANNNGTSWSYVLYTIATESDLRKTISFGAIVGRGAISLSVYRCPSGYEVEQVAGAKGGGAPSSVPAVTSKGPGRMAVVTSSLWTIGEYSFHVQGSNWISLNLALKADARFIASCVLLDAGALPSASFANPDGTDGYSIVTVLFKPINE